MHISIPCVVLAMFCNQTPQGFQTANFEIQADSYEVAKLIGESAETYRKQLGKLWFDKELPAWSFPCRIEVSLTLGMVAGYTNVSFAQGRVRAHRVNLEGPLDRILKGPLPHELTHVLLAHKFGFQPPRWADEGAAILSEDKGQRLRHDKALRRIIAEERCFDLRSLLGMQDYPADVPCLYAQGQSVSRYLVNAKGHKVFLDFLKDGRERGWDAAVKGQYGFSDVEHLEIAWLSWVEKEAASARAGRSEEKTRAGAAASAFGSGRRGHTFNYFPKKTAISFFLDFAAVP